MRIILFLVVIFCGLAGCTSLPKSFRAVWTQSEWPPAELAAPAGFSVTPRQAYSIVSEKPWALSRKHIWHLHADDHYYYVYDPFLGASSRKAFMGVRVDGRTGAIVDR